MEDPKPPKPEQRLEVSQEMELGLYPSVDIEQIRSYWLFRYRQLGFYVTGPLKWTDMIKHDEEAKQKFEAEERRLSECILQVFDKAYPRPLTPIAGTDNFTVLIVATGPGRRVIEYIERAKERGGYCTGIDALEAIVEDLHKFLALSPYSSEIHRFFPGFATHLSQYFRPEQFDVITWERIGNHILKDEEWLFALREGVVKHLKPGGRFQLAETTLEFNPNRTFDPKSSRPRTVEQYDNALGPNMVRDPNLAATCKFADDNYFVGMWQKVASSQKCRQ